MTRTSWCRAGTTARRCAPTSAASTTPPRSCGAIRDTPTDTEEAFCDERPSHAEGCGEGASEGVKHRREGPPWGPLPSNPPAAVQPADKDCCPSSPHGQGCYAGNIDGRAAKNRGSNRAGRAKISQRPLRISTSRRVLVSLCTFGHGREPTVADATRSPPLPP